jgi:aromatic ring-opening dioxygenase catalytic subunit (LigB family)
MDQMPGNWTPLLNSLQAIPTEVGAAPRAVLAVTAHWEQPRFTVQNGTEPPMLYDYGGFPDFTYQIQYPAPGSPEVAEEAAALLEGAGFEVDRDSERGYDHGTFVPLAVMYPEADVPIVQMSLRADLDLMAHVEAGRALAPLRDREVLIVASGVPTFHNFNPDRPPAEPAAAFDEWLTSSVVDLAGQDRTDRLLGWEQAPFARVCHGREEHLVPLFVAAGAAEEEPGFRQYHQEDLFDSMAQSGYRFGAPTGN